MGSEAEAVLQVLARVTKERDALHAVLLRIVNEETYDHDARVFQTWANEVLKEDSNNDSKR